MKSPAHKNVSITPRNRRSPTTTSASLLSAESQTLRQRLIEVYIDNLRAASEVLRNRLCRDAVIAASRGDRGASDFLADLLQEQAA